MGVLSPRFQNATVTRSAGKTVQVLDAAKAVASLKAKGLDTYVSETVNQLFFDSATKEMPKLARPTSTSAIRSNPTSCAHAGRAFPQPTGSTRPLQLEC
jgi:hypothetical protein